MEVNEDHFIKTKTEEFLYSKILLKKNTNRRFSGEKKMISIRNTKFLEEKKVSKVNKNKIK